MQVSFRTMAEPGMRGWLLGAGLELHLVLHGHSAVAPLHVMPSSWCRV